MAVTRGKNFISMSQVGDRVDSRFIVSRVMNGGTANGQLQLATTHGEGPVDYDVRFVDVHVAANDPFVLDAGCLAVNGIRVDAKLSDPVIVYYK